MSVKGNICVTASSFIICAEFLGKKKKEKKKRERVEHRVSPTMKCKRQSGGDENEGREKVQKRPKASL